MSRFTRFCLLVGMVATAAACTVHDVDAPQLAGPSEMALRINLQVVPDSIYQDGASQTVLNIEVTGGDGRAVRGLALRIDITEGGVLYDLGTLSSKSAVTGDDGRARVIYTAPPREIDGTGRIVTLLVTPIGNDYRGEFARQIDVHLVPVGVILPPNGAPVPDFTFTPTTATAYSTVSFDASLTQDEGAPCGPNCTYNWEFGDGGVATGIFATHQFRNVGTYQIRLTATDLRGVSAQVAKAITVGPGTPPTANFVYSPTTPAVSQTVFFNANSSTAAAGRIIVSYSWDFGNGRAAEGVTTSRAFNSAGSYNVTLTVTDDIGQTATKTATITVGGTGTGPTANMIVSPTSGNIATNFFFDASGSTAGPSPIVEYRFTFGDGSPDVVGTSPTTTHRYVVAGSYTARVTIRDSANRTATATQTVAVQ